MSLHWLSVSFDPSVLLWNWFYFLYSSWLKSSLLESLLLALELIIFPTWLPHPPSRLPSQPPPSPPLVSLLESTLHGCLACNTFTLNHFSKAPFFFFCVWEFLSSLHNSFPFHSPYFPKEIILSVYGDRFTKCLFYSLSLGSFPWILPCLNSGADYAHSVWGQLSQREDCLFRYGPKPCEVAAQGMTVSYKMIPLLEWGHLPHDFPKQEKQIPGCGILTDKTGMLKNYGRQWDHVISKVPEASK